MHADQVGTDVALVRRLLAGQFPHWAHLAIEPIAQLDDRVDGDAAVRSMIRQASNALAQVLADS